MSKREMALWIVLADFVLLTVYAIATEGATGFVPVTLAFATNSVWGAQVVIDFLLALAVGLGFVVADARHRGLAWWPFAVLTLTLGSIGPLAYLVFRERAGAPAPAPVRDAAHA